MSRNKYPEETYQLIIDVSMKLFLTKGYEKTSLQDIIDELGGLTKGAIYHHFKSKEEILIAVLRHVCSNNESMMRSICEDPTLTGKEKLEKMFSDSLQNPNQAKVFSITPNLMDNPRFLVYYLQMIMKDTVPKYVIPVVKEGVSDGSIQTDYPEELADSIMFLCDVWMNPLIFPLSSQQIINRAIMINTFFEPFGIKVLDDFMIEKMTTLRNISDPSIRNV